MNSLVADYGDETDTDSLESDLNQDISNIKTVDEVKHENKLPAPKFKESGTINESVFRNPYLEAERAKSAILEKHVKMVPSKNYLTKINGKNICWMNRKGCCRFGNKCKFSHDSELFNDTSIENEKKINNDNHSNKKKKPRLSQTLPSRMK